MKANKLMETAYYIQCIVVVMFLAPLMISIVQCISGKPAQWSTVLINQVVLVGLALLNMKSYKRDMEYMERTDKFLDEMKEMYETRRKIEDFDIGVHMVKDQVQ